MTFTSPLAPPMKMDNNISTLSLHNFVNNKKKKLLLNALPILSHSKKKVIVSSQYQKKIVEVLLCLNIIFIGNGM